MANFKLSYYEENIIESKIQAIKQVYRDWGLTLRRALRQMSPVDRGQLRSSIKFRVESPKKKADITGTVRLLVGILDADSPALRYIRFIVDGTRYHWTPVKTRGGKHTGIFGWAKRHNLLYYGRSGPKSKEAWRWQDGINKGKIFYGLPTQNIANNMFDIVYNKYYNSIMQDVNRILRGE